MFDLNIINEKQKEELYKDYIEYQELRRILIFCFLKKTNVELENHGVAKTEEDKLIKERYSLLEDKLISLGVLVNFDYEKAIMNQVDKEVKTKLLKYNK